MFSPARPQSRARRLCSSWLPKPGEIKRGLTETYDIAEFGAPYARGDGREVEAVKAGKATFITGWENRAGEDGMFLFLDQDADVAIFWEAPGWSTTLSRL